MDRFDEIKGQLALDFIVHIEREGAFLKYIETHPLMVSYLSSKQSKIGETDEVE